MWSSDLTFLMEAHNGLSAKIVEEAGFEGSSATWRRPPGQGGEERAEAACDLG